MIQGKNYGEREFMQPILSFWNKSKHDDDLTFLATLMIILLDLPFFTKRLQFGGGENSK